jgi:hypothetical protein
MSGQALVLRTRRRASAARLWIDLSIAWSSAIRRKASAAIGEPVASRRS